MTGIANLLLESPNLIHWFAMNNDILHPKIEFLPIGLRNDMTKRLGDKGLMSALLKPMVPIFQPGTATG